VLNLLGVKGVKEVREVIVACSHLDNTINYMIVRAYVFNF